MVYFPPPPPPPAKRTRSRSRSRSRDRRRQTPTKASTRPSSTASPSRRASRHTPDEKGKRHKLPDSFKTNDMFYDTTEVYKMPLPKLIEETKWTKEHQLANKDIMELPLHMAVNQGIASYGMRLLANGRYAQFEVMRSFRESVIVQGMLEHMREKDTAHSITPKLDIEAIAANMAKEKGMPYKTGAEKRTVYKEITNCIADYLQSMTPTSGTDKILKEMEALRKENAALKNKRLEEKPAGKSKDKPKLPAEDDEEEEEDPEEDEEPDQQKDSKTCAKAFNKPEKAEEWLGQHFPKSESKDDIKKFIKTAIAKIKKPADKKIYENITNNLNANFKILTVADKAKPGKAAVAWGLGLKTAAAASHLHLVQLIGLAMHNAADQ